MDVLQILYTDISVKIKTVLGSYEQLAIVWERTYNWLDYRGGWNVP